MARLSRMIMIAAVGSLTATSASWPGIAQAAGGIGWYRVYVSGSADAGLADVVAPSAGDAWAVGTANHRALVMHWNGAHWRTAAIPHPAGFAPMLLSASSPANVWMFGEINASATGRVLHLTSTGWVDVPLPTDVIPAEATVLGPSDVWIVSNATTCAGSGSSRHCQSTLYRWDGQKWNPYQVNAAIDSISGTGPRNLWAVAEGSPTSLWTRCTLEAYKWNGSSWARVGSMPSPRERCDGQVTAMSPHGAWFSASLAARKSRVVALRWNGRRWLEITSPRTVDAAPGAVPDGHGGAWLGPWARWNGHRWLGISAFPLDDGVGVVIQAMARIPGRSTVWGVGTLSRKPGDVHALVAAYGRVP